MAIMIPNTISFFGTEGEHQFFKLLEDVAKPDSEYITWYLPNIKGKEPDFVLFCKNIGLIIFEVKDWRLDQIKGASPYYFFIEKSGRSESRKNPFFQARNYFQSLMEKIRDNGQLVSTHPHHLGNPKIPIDFGVVFPNIKKQEYLEKGLDDVIDTQKIFFWDHMHPESSICRDKTGKCFYEDLRKMFPPKFNFNLTQDDYTCLKQLISPMVHIELPNRLPCTYECQREQLKLLDNNQEAIARKCDAGHAVILGPSGSGKTLILVHKAAMLKEYNADITSILFVCYNITLVNYIKRLISQKNVGLGKGGVEVYHFYELCSMILEKNLNYEKEDEKYYEYILSKTLRRLKTKHIQYDAILIDEGQDLSDEMYSIILRLLNKDTNNLTIALDESQNLYRRKLSWKDFEIATRGNIHKASHVYRNTQEIGLFASRFIGKDFTEKNDSSMEFFPFYDFHGPKPEIKHFKKFEEIVSYIVKEIQFLSGEKVCPLSEIAIIHAKKSISDRDIRFLPKKLVQTLHSNGILCNWASENYNAKNAYDITTERVTISTIHSTKGLDYSCVFVLGIDLLQKNGWTSEQLRNMAYVAITRARHRLYIPYIYKNNLIKRFLACL